VQIWAIGGLEWDPRRALLIGNDYAKQEALVGNEITHLHVRPFKAGLSPEGTQFNSAIRAVLEHAGFVADENDIGCYEIAL
jgi:hypothetical protein